MKPADEENLYANLGKYVVFFQCVEAQLRKTAMLMLGLDNWRRSQILLGDLSFRQLLRTTEALVEEFMDSATYEDDEEFLDRLRKAMRRCDGVALQRNSLVHSTYEHVEDMDGKLLGVHRTSLRVRPGRKRVSHIRIEGEGIGESFFDDALREVAECAFDLSQLHIQLVHWYGRRSA